VVFNVRCFKCGEQDVRLVLGGRSVIHAQCHGCDSNLLAEIMELEEEVRAQQQEQSDHDGDPSTVASEQSTPVSDADNPDASDSPAPAGSQ